MEFLVMILLPRITNCIISGNQGSGISSGWDGPILTNCIITANNGGIGLFKSSVNLTNCIIIGNTTSDNGGGISCSVSSLILTNCTIADNITSGMGGGISLTDRSSGNVKNSILWGDTASGSANEIYKDVNSSIGISYSDIPGRLDGTRQHQQ